MTEFFLNRLFDGRSILGKSPPLGELPPPPAILHDAISIAWPSILESFLVALVGVIDTIMVGTVGPAAIAAVGLCTQPKFIALALFISTNVAVSAIVARRRGQGDRDSANSVLLQAFSGTLLLVAFISVIAVAFAPQILRLAGTNQDTHQQAVAYYRVIMGGLIFNVCSLVINAAQRGAGNTKIAMRTNLVSNLVNICFNYLLIGGHFGFPRLGVTGAALATVIGTVAAFLMSLYSVSHPEGFLHLNFRRLFRFDRATLASIWKVSSSTLVEQIFLRIGFLSFAMIIARLGTNAFAAHQAGMNIITISFSLGDGLSVAAVALVGQSLGQNRPDLAKIYGGACQRIGVVFSTLASVVFLTQGRRIFGLFFQEESMLAEGDMIMRFTALIVFLQISQVVFSGCLRGAGDVRYMAMVSLASATFTRPVLGWLFCYGMGMGLTGAWIGLTLDQGLRLVLSGARFAGGRWTKIKI